MTASNKRKETKTEEVLLSLPYRFRQTFDRNALYTQFMCELYEYGPITFQRNVKFTVGEDISDLWFEDMPIPAPFKEQAAKIWDILPAEKVAQALRELSSVSDDEHIVKMPVRSLEHQYDDFGHEERNFAFHSAHCFIIRSRASEKRFIAYVKANLKEELMLLTEAVKDLLEGIEVHTLQKRQKELSSPKAVREAIKLLSSHGYKVAKL